MDDFLLNEAERELKHQIAEFFGQHLEPSASKIEADQDWDAIAAVVRETGRAGHLEYLFGSLDSKQHAGLVPAVMVAEEAARVSYAFESTIASSLSAAVPIERHASPSLRQRYVPELALGREIGAICITEVNVGSDSAGMQTRITYDAAGDEFIVDGKKRYISNAGKADVYVVYGISDVDVPPQKGMSAVLVPRATPGLSFPSVYSLMGRRGSVVGEVVFDAVRVPADHLLGELGAGFRIMVGMFNLERILLGGAGLGVARSAFELARTHALQRDSFGQKLAQKQLIWNDIARMSLALDSAALLTYRAARLFDGGRQGKELMREAAMAKLSASEAAVFCSDRAVQILGGDGLTKQYGRVEQIYRDARALPVVGGTSEMAKYVIASSELGLKLNL